MHLCGTGEGQPCQTQLPPGLPCSSTTGYSPGRRHCCPWLLAAHPPGQQQSLLCPDAQFGKPSPGKHFFKAGGNRSGNSSHAAAVSERRCQGPVWLPRHPTAHAGCGTASQGGGRESPISRRSGGFSRAKEKSWVRPNCLGDQWRQGLIPSLPIFILFTLESNRTFPINLFLSDAIVLTRKLKLFEGGLIERGFLLCSGSVDSAPGKPDLS